MFIELSNHVYRASRGMVNATRHPSFNVGICPVVTTDRFNIPLKLCAVLAQVVPQASQTRPVRAVKGRGEFASQIRHALRMLIQ